MKREIACLKVTPTAGVNDGTYYGTVSLTTGQSYTFSLDIKGESGKPYTIYFATTGGVEQGTSTDFTATGEWERQEVTWACDSTASYRLYITKNNDNNTSLFYIDGLQVENKTYSTTYADGNQKGCKWNGAKHASTSIRDAQSRAGGRVYNLDTYGFYVDDMPGIGMPPLLHQTQEQPLLSGSLLRGFKTKPRVFDLIANQIGDTHEDLHSKRKDLLNAIKPDLVLEPQPFILRYTGANANKPVEIKAVYDSGYQFTKLDGFTERQLPLRFIAYEEPYFCEIGNTATSLTTFNTVTAQGLIAKVDNDWVDMGLTTNAQYVYDIKSDEEYLYICGSFTNLNSDANMDRIARYDLSSETWSALGTGANGSVLELAVAANGDLYATGTFSSMGGVANTAYIARWDGSSWNALGTGLNDYGRALAFDSSGNLFVGGDFTDAGGTTAYYIANWDGSSWSALSGDSLDDSSVYSISIDKNDNLYAGGTFSGIGSDSSMANIAKHDGSSWTALTSGANNTVNAVLVAEDGSLYAAGGFTTIGGVLANRIAKWNGQQWVALGSGLNGTAKPLAFNSDNRLLYVGGAFTSAGGLSLADGLAIWNGSSWAHLDADIAFTNNILRIYNYKDSTYFGFDYTSGDSYTSYTQTITNNGTRSAYPKITISRSGGTSASVQWIKNETTGSTLFIDHSLLDGETLTIDCTEGRRKIYSSILGTVNQSILRSSDFGDFYLMPGHNNISVFVNVVGSPTITANMQWRNTHWSADGVAA
jgi:hypothetical protein